MAQETVVVPDIGSDAGEVVELLVAPGDVVEKEQGLVVLESDKASMEIPSSVAGRVIELLAKVGDELSEGASVAIVETDADGAAAEDARDQSPATAGGAGAPDGADDDDVDETAAAAGNESGERGGVGTANGDADAGSEQIVVPVPDIGTDDSVDLVEINVAVGDEVAKDDTLVTLESDKASMEVPAPAAGRVVELRVREGQQVREGDAILVLQAGGAAASPASGDAESRAAASAPPPQDAAHTAAAAAPAPASARADTPAAGGRSPASEAGKVADVYAGPAVRRLAREFGVPLGEVRGSGPRGRILKEDLHGYVQRALDKPAGGAAIPDVPEVDFAAFGPVDVVERTRIDRVTADNMQRSWLNVPHVTQFDDADITDLEAFRKSLADEAGRRGTRMTPLPFLLKACAVALRHNEKVNASLSDGGTTLTYKRYVHIGMAVDTPAGLVVPVVRDVDRKSLWELAEEVLDLAGRARERKLKPAEMQGAGFTISSLGAIGGRGFTPIVNTPEVAILGVGKAATQPVWDGEAFAPRLLMPLSLSYDHRVVNGGDAGRFLTELVQLLSDLRRLLL
jgi:pyruvate dehydrogenase E2 component (dihydrolipoamide acetyltransferase)